MASPIFGAPLTVIQGETKALSTSADYIAVEPTFHEVKMYCASQWRLALSPALLHCLYYNGTTYTTYLTEVTDKDSTTHLPLDAMTTAHKLYLGTSAPVLGFYFDIGTNVQDEARTLDWEYHKKHTITAMAAASTKTTITVSATHGITTGEVVTITGTQQYNGTWTTESASGSTFVIDTTYVANEATGDCVVFANVPGSDSDGTDSSGDTLKQDGAYTWGTFPTSQVTSFLGTSTVPLGFNKCYWYRFTPSATLDTTTDINEIIPIYKNTDYGYMEPGIEYQFSFSTTRCGGFVVHATAGTPALDISWVSHD